MQSLSTTNERRGRKRKADEAFPTWENEERPQKRARLLPRIGPTLSDSFISQYEVLDSRLIGSGNQSRVYEAIRRSDGLQVAIKCIRDPEKKGERLNVPEFPTPVPLEVGMLLELQRNPQNPYVIHLYDWFEFPDGHILVLEKLSAPWMRLDRFFTEYRGWISERKTRDLFRQMVHAASFLYSHKVQHFNFTQDSMMVNTLTLELKIIGFGSSQHADTPHTERCGPSDDDLQRNNKALYGRSLFGTLGFMLNMDTQGRIYYVSMECGVFCKIFGFFNLLSNSFNTILNQRWLTDDNWIYLYNTFDLTRTISDLSNTRPFW